MKKVLLCLTIILLVMTLFGQAALSNAVISPLPPPLPPITSFTLLPFPTGLVGPTGRAGALAFPARMLKINLSLQEYLDLLNMRPNQTRTICFKIDGPWAGKDITFSSADSGVAAVAATTPTEGYTHCFVVTARGQGSTIITYTTADGSLTRSFQVNVR